MPRRGLFWWILPPVAVLAVATVVAAGWLATRAVARFGEAEQFGALRTQAELLLPMARALMDETGRAPPDLVCPDLSTAPDTSITLVNAAGVTLCDSAGWLTPGTRIAARPEIAAALDGTAGTDQRYSIAAGATVRYVALPLGAEAPGPVLRAGARTTGIEARVAALRTGMLWVALAALAGATLVAAILARRIAAPLERVRQATERYGEGNLEARLEPPVPVPFRTLADSFNRMAGRTAVRVREALSGQGEQEAVLASMQEAVLAVDPQSRVLNLNRAAETLFGTSIAAARGRRLVEVVRNPDLRHFVSRVASEGAGVEAELELHHPRPRTLRARGTVLRNAEGRQIGTLVVLNDVSELRRLERMRREFVANVSHELRTPVTAIRGAAETLLDGALSEPKAAERFVRMLARHAERLDEIIANLLDLSRLEREAEGAGIELSRQPLAPVLRSAVETCRPRAEARDIALELDAAPEHEARINATMLESAVVNLIDNAVRYSAEGRPVRLVLAARDAEVVIEVADEGPGIAPEHLPRLFERFYRVEAGRDRSAGGSGLGLAIVKHIAQVHGGYVDVESRLGKGSRFFLHLPREGETA